MLAAILAVPVLSGAAALPASAGSVAETGTQDEVGLGTLLLAFVIGLTGLGALLLLLALRSRGGRDSLAAVRALALAALEGARERRLPEERRRVPAAEIRRRLADALQDLRAGFGDEPTAMELAWKEALLEDAVWADGQVRERLRQERRNRQAKAAARVAGSLRRAQEREAVERAAREIVELAALDLGDLSEREAARLAEVEAVVSASILAAQHAVADAEEAAAAVAAAAAERAASLQDRLDAEREAVRMAELAAARRDAATQVKEHLVEEAAPEPPIAAGPVSTIDVRSPVHVVASPAASASSPPAAPPANAAPPARAEPSAEPAAERPPDVRVAGPRRAAALAQTPATPVVTSSVPTGQVASSVAAMGAPSTARPPVSAHMAWGAPMVRRTVDVQRRRAAFAVVQKRSLELREESQSKAGELNLEARVARWFLLAVVPSALAARSVLDWGWVDRVLGDSTGRLGLLVALALTGLGTVWVWRVTTPPFVLRRGAALRAEEQLMRSLSLAEQLALRLAAGMAPPWAWHVIATSNGLPRGTASPVTTVDQAVATVVLLRQSLIRRDEAMEGRVATVTIAPFLVCIAPAVALIIIV